MYQLVIKENGELIASVRTYNCLKRYGFTYFEDVKMLSIIEILNIRSLGKRSCAEILRKIADDLEGVQ